MGHKNYKREDLYTVLVFYQKSDGSTGCAKYHNIEVDKPGQWKKAEEYFRRKFPSATHANKYGGVTKQYIPPQIKF